jgi:hypothetical protein
VQTALQPLGIGPVDPGKAGEWRRRERLVYLVLLNARRARHRVWHR